METETVCILQFLGIQNFGGKAGVLWWNPTKNDRNIRERGISFADAQHIEYDTAVVSVDDRKDYGEVREVLAGFIGARLHILVFTRRGETCWVISLRKANKREIQAYVEALD